MVRFIPHQRTRTRTTALARRLQRYVVQIPEPVTRQHLGRGLSLLHERFLILDDKLAYSEDLGLQLVTDRLYDPEQLIVS